jgi:hypothetical protein
MVSIPNSVVVAAHADLAGPVQRPTVPQWLRYAVTGTVPPRCYTWVLRDITARTWALRHAARSLVLLSPLIIMVLLLPVSAGMKGLLLANAGIPGFFGCMLLVLNATERRLARAGYPGELGTLIRQRRAEEKQVLGNHARRERIAARQARRSGIGAG